MTTVAAVLSRAKVGVSEARFAALVGEALAELGAPAVEDPAATLSPTDREALLAVGADLSPRRPREPDPRAAAAAGHAALLAGSFTVGEVARRLHIDPSRVRHRLAAHQLLGIRRPGGWLLPAYQFDEGGAVLPGLATVATALPDGVHPVVVARMFATPVPELTVDGRRLTPREWLTGGGDPAAVVALVRTLDLAP